MRFLRPTDQSGGNLLWLKQTLLFHPFIGMELGKVMFARIANYEHDDRVGVCIASYAQGCSEIRSRRAATKNAFGTSQLARQVERLAIGDINHIVDVFDVHVGRNHFLADSFDEVRGRLNKLSRLFISLEDRAVWICANDFDPAILFFQKASGAGDSSTGSDAGNKMSDSPVCLFPDFRPGRAIVDFGIGSLRGLVRTAQQSHVVRG